jgi:succinyl-CoA synthetase beta subunit
MRYDRKGCDQCGEKVGLKIPRVVRLEGTNVDLGQKIFSESGLPIITEAGEKAVDAVKKV